MSKSIFLIRHGTTLDIEKDIFQSFTSALSEKGQQEIQKSAQILQKMDVESVIHSPVLRAQQSAFIISSLLQKPSEPSEIFVERRFPSEIIGTKISSNECQKVLQTLRDHRNDEQYHYADEENFFDLYLRAKHALQFLESREENRIAVVSHGYFMTMILFSILFPRSFDSNFFPNFKSATQIDNASISQLQFENKHWKIISLNQNP